MVVRAPGGARRGAAPATPLYSRETPELFGFPFFYWYQFAWVPLSVLITYLVYTRTRTVGRAADEPPSSSGFTE